MQTAVAQAGLMLDGRLHRIDVTAREGEFSLDKADPETIRRLVTLGRGEAVKKANFEVVESRFLNKLAASAFVPIHTLRP